MQRFLIVAISLISALYIAFSVKLSGLLGGHDGIAFAAVSFVVFAVMFFILNRLLKNIKTSVRNVWTVLFIAFLGVFVLACLTGMNFTGDVSVVEKRQLAKFPRRSPFHERFPDEFNKFIDDRVGFRDYANKFYGLIRPIMLDDANMSKKALIGRNNWLFLNMENDDVRHYQRVVTYTQKEFGELKKHLDKMQDFCNANGIDLYFIMPPNKSTIYPEYYPDFIKQLDRPSYYEIISDYIKENTKVRFIDIYDKFMEHKNDYDLFYRGDTHWNSAGGYIAYKEIAAAIQEKHPDFKFIRDEDVSRYNNDNAPNGLVDFLNGYDYSPISSPEVCIKNPVKINVIKETGSNKHVMTSNTKGLKIMLFHDSFFMSGMQSLISLVYEGASEVKNVWFYYTSPLAYEKEILEYKPDIIIWEMLERYVPSIMLGNISYEKP